MAYNDDLISRSKALKDLRAIKDMLVAAGDPFLAAVMNRPIDRIKNQPAVDAVEVVHGEWSTIEDDYCGLTALQCSECNQEYWFEDEPPMKIYNYCPNCGAKMDGGADNGTAIHT